MKLAQRQHFLVIAFSTVFLPPPVKSWACKPNYGNTCAAKYATIWSGQEKWGKTVGKLRGNKKENPRRTFFRRRCVCVCAKNDVAQKIAVHNFRHFPATLRAALAAEAWHVCCMPLCAPQQWPAYVAPEVMPVDDVAAFCVCVCGEGGVS